MGEHRRSFYKLCKSKDYDEESDEYALGLHLSSHHNLISREDFDMHHNVALLDFCSPKTLDVKEHKLMHLLNILKPNDLNLDNPSQSRYFIDNYLDFSSLVELLVYLLI